MGAFDRRVPREIGSEKLANTLRPGELRAGHLYDGIDDGFPDQAATLAFDEKRGLELAVPYLWESEGGANPQYLKARQWFDFEKEELPKTLLYEDDRGSVTLTGAYPSGASWGDYPIGRIRARASIFGRPRTLQEEYKVEEFRSRIDGLEEFAGFHPVTIDHQAAADGHLQTTVLLDAAEVVEWQADGFRYAIQSSLTWHGGRSFTVDDSRPFMSTTMEGGGTLRAHLHAQRPIRALLILAHGIRLAWRTHTVLDAEFPSWMSDGSDRGAHPVEVQMAGTIEQQHLPMLTPTSLGLPALRLRDLGADRMRRWVELYGDSNFRRAVEPAVEVINGASEFLEPQLMMLAMSLDYFGYFRWGDRRRRSMADNIQKCLQDAHLDWPEIGSQEGVARAIANANNDLKHPDRENTPDPDVLAGVTRLAEIIARAQVFDTLDLADEVRRQFVSGNDARHAVGIFTHNGITITDNGSCRRNP